MHGAFFMPFGRDIKVLSKRFFHAVKGVMPLSVGKWCFSKKLLIADYVIMGVILIVLLALIVGDKNATEWSAANRLFPKVIHRFQQIFFGIITFSPFLHLHLRENVIEYERKSLLCAVMPGVKTGGQKIVQKIHHNGR